MHPKLFTIPLPHGALPLGIILLAVLGLGVLLAAIGFIRSRRVSALVIGGVILAIVGALGRWVWLPANQELASSLSSIPVYSYGVMLGVSLVVGWYLTLGLAGRDGLPKDTMANCYVVTALAAVAGSRILYVLTNLDEFHSPMDVFAMRSGGLVAYGGFLGGFVGSWLFLNFELSKLPKIQRRRYPISILPWADVAVPSLASGLFITRIGCYLFGCDFGRPLGENAPEWLKKLGTFPRWPDGTLPGTDGSPAWAQHVKKNGLSPDAMHSLPVHPTQIYESLIGLALLVFLLSMRRKQKFRGEIFLLFTFSYGVCRYLLEILRGDDQRGGLGLAMPTYLLVPGGLVIFAIAFTIGFSRLIRSPGARRVAQIASFVPAIVFFVAMKPASFAQPEVDAYSTSQLVAMVTALASGIGFSALWSSAQAHPESAMALHLPPPDASDASEVEPAEAKKAADADEEDDDEAPKKVPPKRVKKAKKAKPAAVEESGEEGEEPDGELAPKDA